MRNYGNIGRTFYCILGAMIIVKSTFWAQSESSARRCRAVFFRLGALKVRPTFILLNLQTPEIGCFHIQNLLKTARNSFFNSILIKFSLINPKPLKYCWKCCNRL